MALATKPFDLVRENFVIMLLLEALEHGSTDQAPAVIGSNPPVGYNEHASLWFLHHHLAGRHEDPEVDNCRLRPVLEPLGNRPAVLPAHKVELAFLCGAACAD